MDIKKVNLKEINSFDAKYDFKEDLAKGCYSVVKRCSDKKTGQEFAVKVIYLSKLTAREYNRLDREAMICRKLKHQNVVRLFTAGKENGCFYMLFELMNGGDLFDLLVALEYVTESQTSFLIKQVLEGIKYYQSLNIIHRDLKLENLLLVHKSPNSRLKISDFGLALQTDGDKYGRYGFVGTLNFMAPEIVKKQNYGKPIDIWSCGVVLYTLLAGYPPFWEENKDQLLNRISNADFKFSPPEWASITLEAKDLIASMLNVNPQNRISSQNALGHKWITNNDEVTRNFSPPITLRRTQHSKPETKLKGLLFAMWFLVITKRNQAMVSTTNAEKSSNVSQPLQPSSDAEKPNNAPQLQVSAKSEKPSNVAQPPQESTKVEKQRNTPQISTKAEKASTVLAQPRQASTPVAKVAKKSLVPKT